MYNYVQKKTEPWGRATDSYRRAIVRRQAAPLTEDPSFHLHLPSHSLSSLFFSLPFVCLNIVARNSSQVPPLVCAGSSKHAQSALNQTGGSYKNCAPSYPQSRACKRGKARVCYAEFKWKAFPLQWGHSAEQLCCTRSHNQLKLFARHKRAFLARPPSSRQFRKCLFPTFSGRHAVVPAITFITNHGCKPLYTTRSVAARENVPPAK